MACIGSGKRVDDPLRNDILDLLSDIATSSEPALREIGIKNVWRKTFKFVIKHLLTFETRTKEFRNGITSSTSPESRFPAIQRQQTHLISMQRIREFFEAYPKVMGETLEWQEDWKRIMSGETIETLSAMMSARFDRPSTASMDGAGRPACIDKATLPQPVGQQAHQSELVGVDSPEIEATTDGEKTSNIDGIRRGMYCWSFTSSVSSLKLGFSKSMRSPGARRPQQETVLRQLVIRRRSQRSQRNRHQS